MCLKFLHLCLPRHGQGPIQASLDPSYTNPYQTKRCIFSFSAFKGVGGPFHLYFLQLLISSGLTFCILSRMQRRAVILRSITFDVCSVSVSLELQR